MTYNEYKEWLKAECIDLSDLNVKINNNLFVNFEIGCYDNHDGTWTYYRCEERGVIKEIGTEDEVFDKMKIWTTSKVVEYEYEMRCKVHKSLLSLLEQMNLASDTINKLSEIIVMYVRYKIGNGFAIFEIKDGQEVRKSDFFKDERLFLEFLCSQKNLYNDYKEV